MTIDVSGASYKVDQGNIDTSGIGGLPSSPTLPFDATTIHAGQAVDVESSNSMSGSSTVAGKVKLQQQTLTGTVSGLAAPTSAGPVTSTLTVASDSAFAMLAGQTTVTVYWLPGTDLHNIASVSNGNTVRVRGLVFLTETGIASIVGSGPKTSSHVVVCRNRERLRSTATLMLSRAAGKIVVPNAIDPRLRFVGHWIGSSKFWSGLHLPAL